MPDIMSIDEARTQSARIQAALEAAGFDLDPANYSDPHNKHFTPFRAYLRVPGEGAFYVLKHGFFYRAGQNKYTVASRVNAALKLYGLARVDIMDLAEVSNAHPKLSYWRIKFRILPPLPVGSPVSRHTLDGYTEHDIRTFIHMTEVMLQTEGIKPSARRYFEGLKETFQGRLYRKRHVQASQLPFMLLAICDTLEGETNIRPAESMNMNEAVSAGRVITVGPDNQRHVVHHYYIDWEQVVVYIDGKERRWKHPWDVPFILLPAEETEPES